VGLMKTGLKLAAALFLAVMLPLIACSQSQESTTGLLTAPATPTAITTVITPADEAKLEAMIAQHQRVRSQLPAEYRQELDRLMVQVRRQLFTELPQDNLLESAAKIIKELIPGLTVPEASDLAEYVLGGIASNDAADEALMNATKLMQEMSQSFNIQYLQLQQNMQQENRQFTMISNIMKNKHDTIENSLNNIR
jgi:hypothetical protein